MSEFALLITSQLEPEIMRNFGDESRILLVALAHGQRASPERSKQALGPVKHDVVGFQFGAVDAVDRDRNRILPRAHSQGAHLGQFHGAARQHIQRMAGCFEKRTRVNKKCPWTVVIDDIKRRVSGRNVAVIRLACPGGPTGLPGIFLRDRAAHQRSAGNRPVDRNEIGAETDRFMMLRPAAVFAYGIIHADHRTAGSRGDCANGGLALNDRELLDRTGRRRCGRSPGRAGDRRGDAPVGKRNGDDQP